MIVPSVALFTKTFFLGDGLVLSDFAMSQSPPEIKISRQAEYRIVAATGIFGGLFPIEGHLIFYTDRLEPKSDNTGKMSLGSVNRELQVEIHVSPATFKSIAEWMTKHVKEFEEREKQEIKPVKMDQKPVQWV